MSNAELIDLVKENISMLDKENLVLVLSKKEGNIFGEKSLREKYGQMNEDQLREEIMKSYEKGFDVFDSAFVCMLPTYLKGSEQDNSAVQEFVDDVMQNFEFDNGQYEDKKRRQNVIEILTNEALNLEVKSYISELLMNEYELDDSDHDEQLEIVFLNLIYELLYVTTSKLNLASLRKYQG